MWHVECLSLSVTTAVAAVMCFSPSLTGAVP